MVQECHKKANYLASTPTRLVYKFTPVIRGLHSQFSPILQHFLELELHIVAHFLTLLLIFIYIIIFIFSYLDLLQIEAKLLCANLLEVSNKLTQQSLILELPGLIRIESL